MRMNYILDKSTGSISNSHIQEACRNFYNKFKTVPDTVKMTYEDFNNFNSTLYNQQIQVLEKDKKYAIFMMVPGGFVELSLLEEDIGIQTINAANTMSTVIVLESSLVDKEFEKHILNEK